MQLGRSPNPSYTVAKALLNYVSSRRSRYPCPVICLFPWIPLFLLTSVLQICVANVIISNSPSNSSLHQSCESWFGPNKEVLKGKRDLRLLWVVDWNCASILAGDSTKGSSEPSPGSHVALLPSPFQYNSSAVIHKHPLYFLLNFTFSFHP